MQKKLEKGVSVVICCHNSEERIYMPLLYLSKQLKNPEINYELIIVNNGSLDNTSHVSQSIWNDLGSPFKLMIIDEPILGLSNARKKGLLHINYEYVMFCDDDNMPCYNFLNKVYDLFENNPQYSCIGSKGLPEFGNELEPNWFKYEKQNFAIAEISNNSNSLTSVNEVVGACATFKASILIKLFQLGFVFHNSGRLGKLLIGGEDLELSYALILSGERLAISSDLTFKHFLPSKRLCLSYLIKLHNSFGASFVSLDPYIDLINNKQTSPWYIIIFRKARLLLGYRDKFYDYIFNPYKNYDIRLLQLSFTIGYLKMILLYPKRQINIRKSLDLALWRR